MGLFDSLLGNSADGDNHQSPIGALGSFGQKYTDPLSWIFGDKWTNLVSNKIPELANSGISKVMQPFEKIDKTINPVRRIPIVDKAGDWIANKPVDTLGALAGAVYGGGALLGGMGAGGAAGGAGTAGATGAGTGGAGSGISTGLLGNGMFDTTAAYASPLAEGLGTGTAGMGMGATGTSAATLPAAAGSSGLSAEQFMQLARMGNSMAQQGQPQQTPQVSLQQPEITIQRPKYTPQQMLGLLYGWDQNG